MQEDQEDLLSRKHVGVKTNREGQVPRQMTEQLNRQHQRRQPPDGTGEMPQILAQTHRLDALDVVIEKRGQSASQRDLDALRRRFKARDQSNQVAEQNEDADRHHDGDEGMTVTAGLLLGLSFGEVVEEL